MVCDTLHLQNEFGDPQFFFYVFNRILSFSTCSQSLKKKSVRGNFWARTSLISSQFPCHVFPSLPDMKTMWTRFQWCCERTTMLGREGEMVEPQRDDRKEKLVKKDRNSKDEGRELLITLYEERACFWDVTWIGTKIGRTDVRHKGRLQRQTETSDFFGNIFIAMPTRYPLFSKTIFPRLATGTALNILFALPKFSRWKQKIKKMTRCFRNNVS